jgi:hypothetical protein
MKNTVSVTPLVGVTRFCDRSTPDLREGDGWHGSTVLMTAETAGCRVRRSYSRDNHKTI